MSFYSSLILFYPGRSPQVNVGSLRIFCDNIRSTFNFGEWNLEVKLWYKANDNACSDIVWRNADTIGTCEECFWGSNKWDHTASKLPWPDLWPGSLHAASLIRRASINLGALPQGLGEELTAVSTDDRSYFVPSKFTVSMGPVMPMTLDDDLPQNECYGDIKIAISGMGYFTWQSLNNYWETVKHRESMQTLLRICRTSLASPALPQNSAISEKLGEMFLNRREYQEGDWIVSVSESG